MAEVRRFTLFPAAFRLGHEDGELCVWFTDLRYVLPVLEPPFQFRVCRSRDTLEWSQVESSRLLRIRDLGG